MSGNSTLANSTSLTDITNAIFSQPVFNLTQECYANFSTPSALQYRYDYRNFNNCLHLSNLTTAVRNGDLPDRTIDRLERYGVTANTGSVDLWRDIVDQTNIFFHDACKLSNCLEVFPNSTCANLNITDTILNEAAIKDCRNDICMGVKRAVEDDPDIGGIGVFISYAIQIVLALLIALHVAHRWFIRVASRRRSEHRIPLSSTAFNEACMNFHKTQCWFVATIVTAAFIRRATDSVSLIDTNLLLSVTLSGMTLVTFTLMALYYLDRGGKNGRTGQGSWYVYILSFITFALCAVFMIISLKSRAVSKREWDNATSLCRTVLEEIDERKLVVEYITNNTKIPRRLYVIALVFCALVMSGLFVRQSHEVWVSVKQTRLWRFGRVVVTIIVLGMYAALFAFVIFGLNLFASLVDTNMWGFGQIVALFIWIPIVLDYIHDRYRERRPSIIAIEGDVESMVEYKGSPGPSLMSSPPVLPGPPRRDYASYHEEEDIGEAHGNLHHHHHGGRQASASEPMLQRSSASESVLHQGYTHVRTTSDADDRVIHRARTDFV